MEPRVFTRGNDVLIAAFGPKLISFNGATRVHAWKRVHRPRFSSIRPRCASMEPRVFTRGNKVPITFSLVESSSFNGATRVHAWKLHSGCSNSFQRQASMEPRVFTRGNRYRATS